VRSIRETTFTGGHYQRGLARGQRLRDSLRVPEVGLPQKFIDACMQAAGGLYSPCIEEFEGLVRGGGFDRQRMKAYYFARLESRLGGCTMFAVESPYHLAGNGPLVGRNYDWAVGDLRWCELQRYETDAGMRRIGYTHHWAGCPDVLNEAGLYVAIASLPPEPVTLPGVQWSILVDAISETCATVAQAVAVCSRVRHLRPMSYLLADAAGGVAVVEATPTEVRLRGAAGGLVVAANAAQGGKPVAGQEATHTGYALPTPVGGERVRHADSEPSRRRTARAAEMLRACMPNITEATVRDVLRDHHAPICTGDHDDPDGAPWGTIWSGVCRPADGAFAIAPGLPCRHDYREYRL